jgi:hypothetical protein
MNQCPLCGESLRADGPARHPCARGASRQRGVSTGSGMDRVIRAVQVGLGATTLLLVTYLVGTMAGMIPEVQVRVLGPDGATPSAFLIDPMLAAAPPPLVLELVEGGIVELGSGDHFDAPFEVRDPRPCTLTGQVRGIAGGSRDIEVYVLDDDGYLDWRNGIRPRPLFESGRSSATTLAVELPRRGRYHLLLSNRYSIITPKRLRVDDARLRCA